MPLQLPLLIPQISAKVYNVLNLSILIGTFVESYVFPFAFIKWIIIIIKYGGLFNFAKNRSQPDSPSRSRYNYSLELLTSNESKKNKNYTVQNVLSHVSVIVESEFNYCNWIQLSYCGQECQKIPPALCTMYGPKVQYLDLSYNSIETLKGLEKFPRLEELILDNNNISDAVSFPHLPRLRTLSLNNNQITDLEGLINKIKERFPVLSYLSLLSNKACPNQLSDANKDDSDYQRYRYFVIYKLPQLRFLDSRRVSSSERDDAATRGQFASVRRPRCDVIDARAPPTPASPSLRPLPVDLAALGKHRGAYGKCNFKYTGKHSEGNRFIVNSDL